MTQPLAIGTVLRGRYRIIRLVGGGGMAWVYQVEELPEGSGRLWALKELRPQTQDKTEQATGRKLFEQEARLLRLLSHTNIPTIADFFEEDGRAYVVMEFIWGDSLEKRLTAANAPLLETDVLKYAVQLCDALHYLHTRQPAIIFRDMKPSNAMVTNVGLVKLIDFGIARTYKAGKKRDTIAMGSENYAAPEQWGKGQTDARSDVYALGATMYHLLANMAPTPAFLPSEPLPLANYNGAVSKKTVAIIERAMARERERRFQSAVEMRDALLAALPSPYQSPASVNTAQAAAVQPPAVTPAKVEAGSAALTLPRRTAQPKAGEARPLAAEPTLPRQAPLLKPSEAEPATAAPQPQHNPQPLSLVPSSAVAGRSCTRCGHGNQSKARFCTACGAAMDAGRPAILRVVEPVRAAWEMPVARNPMLLGRASLAEGYVPDFDMTFYDGGDYVSRRHARITTGRGGHFITDLGSSNGTTVNGRRLVAHRAHRLADGDRVQVGLVVIQFCTK